MSEWEKLKLGEVANIQTGPFGSQLHASDYVSDGVPSIMPTNIGDSLRINPDGISFIRPTDAARLSRYLVAEGDIIYSRRGDVEKCAFISAKEHGWLCGTGCLRIRFMQAKANSKYCSYYLSTEEIKGWVSGNAVGTTMPNLNSSILENLPLTLPPLAEQRAIAGVLSSLDDKIDLLRRQNKTLEAMAEALYKRWFIEEADEGWEEVSLKDVVNISIGRTPPRKESQWFSEKDTDIKWISIKDLATSGIFVFNTSEYLVKEAVARFNIPIIPKDTVILSFKMTVGRVAITSEPMVSNEAIAQFVLSHDAPLTKEYLYMFFKNFKFDALGSTSSIVTAINSAMIKEMPIKIPGRNVMDNFEFSTADIFDRIKKNQIHIHTLIALRDTLLPKLMSGEVRVKTGTHDA